MYTHVKKKSKSEYRSVCDRKYLVDVLNFVTLTLIEIIQRADVEMMRAEKFLLFLPSRKIIEEEIVTGV